MQQKIKKRMHDIDRAVGLIIVLVVLGHLADQSSSANAALIPYLKLKQYIYSFHMPVFMFFSGALMYYSYKQTNNIREYLTYIKRRFIRLIPPFILFGLLIFIGKSIAQSIGSIDNPITSTNDLFEILYKPKNSVVGFLWYIYVLFELNILLATLLYFVKTRIELLFLPSLIIHFIPVTNLFGLDLVFEYLFVFVLGGIFIKHYKAYTNILDKHGQYFILAFFIASIFFFYHSIPKFFMGLLAIFAVHSFTRKNISHAFGILEKLGYATFSIYLMNTIFIGITKLTIFRFTTLTYADFNYLIPVLLLSGVCFPILAKSIIEKRAPKYSSFIS